MSYEYNPLLKLNFQKKSEVSPSDIEKVEGEISDVQTSVSDLQQKKVTKFFTSVDTLEDGEIAQYQGNDDAVFNLINGYFYKKNPEFVVVTDETQQHSLNVADFLVYDFSNNLVLTQKYVGTKKIQISAIIGNLDGGSEQKILLIEVSGDYFDLQYWNPVPTSANTYLAPYYLTFDDNNNLIAKSANITSENYRYYIDGQQFKFLQSGSGISSYISIDNNLFYYWWRNSLRGTSFCIPLLFANSNYNEAKLIGTMTPPKIYARIDHNAIYSTLEYYDYTINFNNTLFTRVDTQPGTVVDSELSDTSTNPVQNAIITNALSTKITNAGKSAQASTDAKSIYVITQSEYDALTNIIPDQLYFII